MRIIAGSLVCGAALAIAAPPTEAETKILTVGTSGSSQYRTISAAVAAADADSNAQNYYDIQVAPGTYTNDFSVVTRPMTVEVDRRRAGNPVLVKATVPLPLTFASLTVDGLTIMGAMIDNSLGGNGAGIRDQNAAGGTALMVRNSVFINNQEGILTGDDTGETIAVTNSKFENNGNPDPRYFQHALYVNHAGSLTVVDSLFCGQLIGHDIKSRALVTSIENNQIYDGEGYAAVGCRAGSSSFAIDIPEGGSAVISGNRIVQGPATQNNKIVAYGEEGLPFGNNGLSLSNNVFINSAPNATGIYDPKCVPVHLTNNTFQGVATPVNPSGCAVYK